MKFVEYVTPAYEVPATGKRPAQTIRERRIALLPSAIVAVEEPEVEGEPVEVRTATHQWEIAGTYEEAVALWLTALTETYAPAEPERQGVLIGGAA